MCPHSLTFLTKQLWKPCARWCFLNYEPKRSVCLVNFQKYKRVEKKGEENRRKTIFSRSHVKKEKKEKVRSIRFESIVFASMITFGTFRRSSRHFEKEKHNKTILKIHRISAVASSVCWLPRVRTTARNLFSWFSIFSTNIFERKIDGFR